MIRLILASIYLMLPAYFANMAPVLLKNYLKFLAVPVDFNKKIGGKPIFGKHKTWRGIFVACIISMFVFYVQQYLYRFDIFKEISLLNYSEHTLFLGFLLGFGAIIGDLIKSFFKRRFNIKPGAPWIPFDQLDFVTGALLFSSIIYLPPWNVILIILLISFFGHILMRHIGYWFGITKEKW